MYLLYDYRVEMVNQDKLEGVEPHGGDECDGWVHDPYVGLRSTMRSRRLSTIAPMTQMEKNCYWTFW